MNFSRKNIAKSYQIVALFTVIMLVCANVYAAELSVRTGEHKNYSRIVFEFNSSFSHKIEKKSDTLLKLSFNKNTSFDPMLISSAEKTNIRRVDIASITPLSLNITVSKNSKHRVLKAGRKLILDVYSPPSGKSARDKNAVNELKARAENNPQIQVSEVKEPSQKELKASNIKKDTKDPQSEKLDKKGTVKKPILKEMSKILDTNMITISSTRSIGMAVFERDGYLWMVADKEQLFIRPQAAGSNAEQLKEFQEITIKGGQAFRVKLPGKAYINGAGSGLLWRVKLSPEAAYGAAKAKPSQPKRRGGALGGTGGGTIFWPLDGAVKVMDVLDPRTGETLKSVSVLNSKALVGPARSFAEFDVVHSPIGLTIRPKVDDLNVKIVQGGVEITRPGGLSLLPQQLVASALPHNIKPKTKASSENKDGEVKAVFKAIYRLPEWEMGGPKALEENRNSILSSIPEMDEASGISQLVTLAKMHLANGFAAEALGFLNLAQSFLPELESNIQFLAVRGAAKALDWKYESAFNDLLSPSLKEFDDVNYWKAFALAGLSDWKQAGEVMPKDIKPIFDYPDAIRDRLALGLAEVALRAGNIEQAEELLGLVQENIDNLMLPQKATLKYLEGEAARQQDNVQKTYTLWKELIDGEDDLYRAKAGLAHTRLQIEENKLDSNKAIDTLERLRYSWRGDELETQVNYWLGRTYFESDNFLKGLRIMRDSASIAPTPEYAREIISEMGEVFSNLYLGDKLKNVSPLDAVALYEQFAELVPSGERGNQIIEGLSHHLVKANLLTRAGELLEHQIKHRLNDEEIVRVGIRLSAIRLSDDKPKEALKILDWIEGKLQKLPEEYPKEQTQMDITVLRIKALSELDRPDEALEILEGIDPSPTINKLRADVAWTARYWDDAADALNQVIIDEEISLTRPLSDEQARIILNRAIALNLDNDRIAITNMREKYSVLMNQTSKARIFEVITRPRQNVKLADRETLLSSVSEVELFKDFMDSYHRTLSGETDQ